MSTFNFKTKTEIIERNNFLPNDNVWPVAIDVGYSAVKGFSPNKVFRFPSFAKRIEEDDLVTLNGPQESDFYYKDLSTGELWAVGESAQALIDNGDTSDSEASLYGRERYDTPMFMVLLRVGLGVGLLSNGYRAYFPNKRVYVQSGLPDRYRKKDTRNLLSVICQRHHFAIKIGKGPWKEFNVSIGNNDANVMSQPMGTLYSICTDNNGKTIKEAKEFMSKNIMIVDPGFGTLDVFPIKKGHPQTGDTDANLGMKRVFSETTDRIFEAFGEEIPVHALQNYLADGKITVLKKEGTRFISNEESFDDILIDSSNKVCDEAVARITSVYNMKDYQYFVLTGGTGAAWSSRIKEAFSSLKHLTIINGAQNDQLPAVFANCRGYYFFACAMFANEKKQAG